ncbi:hypothetical protein SMD44_05114 [Streptomyces alboflavus]|uniref:Uncharacterized protein n=1 Tax=Streptomyces alboflavus TaxID=67267 RepID=A0A1Z1WGZ5_9ACTN|nr:hypothetical protein [Streptomyces alboflavus]ARX85650.1 hypothetical protein SMD44_05114 [Streptomyces alboflavus]
MTVDPVLALVALLAAVAVALVGRFAGRRSPGPLCQPDPLTARGASPSRCPACAALTKKGHR